jgi:Asparaginase
MKFQDCVAKQVLNCYFVQKSRFSPFKPCHFASVDWREGLRKHLSSVQRNADSTMAISGWRIVLHGGCADTCPDIDRQQGIENNLSRIAKAVGKILKQGATAKDVVAQVVSALEDCSLFNAGRGSVLTLDGVHEVKDVNL